MKKEIPMKVITAVLFSMLLIFSHLDAQTFLDADSKIVRVIVYPEWAFVTRKAPIKLEQGLTRVVFRNLPAWIDPESVQIGIKGSDDIRISGTISESVFITQIPEKDVQESKDRIRDLSIRIENLRTELKALVSEKEFYDNLVKWRTDKVDEKKESREIKTEELGNIGSFIRSSFLANLKRTDEINRILTDLNTDLQTEQKKWQGLQSKANMEKKNIIVDLEAKKPGLAELSVSYLNSGAGWYPKYEVHTGNNGKNLVMTYNVMIKQSTGEDWDSASFKISTIKPYLVRERPELNPWVVSSSRDLAENTFSRGRNEEMFNNMAVIQKKQKDMVSQDARQSAAYQNYINDESSMQDVIRQSEERGATAEFEIPAASSVKSDGKPVKMLIADITLEAKKRFSSVPSVSLSTFVSGVMKNTSPYPLLPGIVEIYREGSFIGKSKIGFVASQEKMELTMGLEERIKVTRNLDIKKSSSTIFGNRKVMKIGFNIDVQNFLDEPVSILVSDQLPVSESDAIKVKNVNIVPQQTKLEKGVITWDLPLNAQEKKSLYFEFEVEYPRDASLRNIRELEKTMDTMME
jgi:uncharacterized protein (TIGR02231 family)